MKHLRFCLFLFAFSCLACALAAFYLTRYQKNHLEPEPESSVAAETEPQSLEAALQESIQHIVETTAAEEYYLVCEDGFLLAFARDQKTICLYTHIPITDFPVSEQEQLREGIWFSDMMEVFHYLESYTS
ncbi:MAG: hypothetical protein LIO81_12225 [Clostridiales bacterium]|nr:hypothetical protein [Clostridiales bacterium]